MAEEEKSASTHTILGNKLSNIAKRMKANERHKGDTKRYQENVATNERTKDKYKQRAEQASRKKQLDQQQRKQVEGNLRKQHKKKRGASGEREAEVKKAMEEIIDSMQQDAYEIDELRKEVDSCDVTNIIHSAKISRIAEKHFNKAKSK